MSRDYGAGHCRRFHPNQYRLYRDVELLRQPIRRDRQWNIPRRLFQRWRCHMDACESTTAATSHRGCGWCECCRQYDVRIPHYIHHRRKDMVTGHRRKRGIRVLGNSPGGEIWTDKHGDITQWPHLGGGWHRHQQSRILSKRDSLDTHHERNDNDDECARNCICCRGPGRRRQRRHYRDVRCRQRRLGCRRRYHEFSYLFLRRYQLERSPKFSHDSKSV